MKNKQTLNLVGMAPGQSGRIVSFTAGAGFSRRLNSMGIRVGVKATKISGIPLRGPVVVQVGGTRIALGHGMARKIIIEV